jgi:putative Mg2+ transporter-C (MgtC) family protein
MDEWFEISFRLGLATVAGIVLGANRWLHHKSAGVKTHAMVCMGAAVAMMIFMPLDKSGTDQQSTDAASRVLQGLITGIGFLGAGVIIHNARGTRIQGLTTAASIWITMLIGAGIGAGQWTLGLIALLATGLVLISGNAIERWISQRFADPSAEVREEDRP